MFDNTLAIVDDCGLTYLHVFPFSPRPGTPAARMPQLDRGAGQGARRAAAREGRGGASPPISPPRRAPRRQVLVERGGIGRTEHFTPAEIAGRPGDDRRRAHHRPHKPRAPRSPRRPDHGRDKGLFRRVFGGADAADAGAPPPSSADTEPQRGWFDAAEDPAFPARPAPCPRASPSIFTKRKLDAAALEEFEDMLIQADLGARTAARDRRDARAKAASTRRSATRRCKAVLAARDREGAGAGRAAARHRPGAEAACRPGRRRQRHRQDDDHRQARREAHAPRARRVVLAAGDTFRAAAIEQLKIWGERTGAPVVAGETGRRRRRPRLRRAEARRRPKAPTCC